MSSKKHLPIENKLSGLERSVLANCERIRSGFSVDFQRILDTSCAVYRAGQSREIVRRKVVSGRAELSGPEASEHEDAPKARPSCSHFIIFLRAVFLHLRLVLTWFG